MAAKLRWRCLLLPTALAAASLLFGCDAGRDRNTIYTLYRDSIAGESTRVHVATFDAAENEQYNRSNCEQAQTLFQNRKDVKTHFWCEKGRFKK